MRTEKLIQRIAQGDGKALEALYTELSRMVFALSLAIVRQKQDAEDILSETFVAVWQSASTYRGGSGKSWVCSIARNLSLNLVKKKKREQVGEIPETAAVDFGLVGRVENKIVLEQALACLDERERETVLLYNSGFKHKEIAEITGEKLGTVTWRYQNSLQKLRKILGE